MSHHDGPKHDAGAHPWHMHGAAANYAKMDIEEIDQPWRP